MVIEKYNPLWQYINSGDECKTNHGSEYNSILEQKITVAAFVNTSSEKLVEKMSFPKVYLPNDKERDFETVLPEIEKSEYLILFGQKPLIKKVFIELVANKSDDSLKTNFDYKNLESEFKKNNVQFQESSRPGNSFCNAVYYKTLEYVKLNNLNCKVLFLHIPFQNQIDDIQTFSSQIEKAIINSCQSKAAV